MKAMILAAGLGTRLLPYTEHTPKSLFTVSGRPLLNFIIKNLIAAGCKAIIINTHHLHRKIETFIAGQQYSVPIYLRYEPTILGTGGAIKNVANFWNHQPFMVVNGDIFTDINLKKVYHFHCRHPHPVTLVLYDNSEFNSVACDYDGFITGFYKQLASSTRCSPTRFTFTGIQVLDPEVLRFIPDQAPSSSIDAYTKMIAAGKKVKAYIPLKAYWKDIGTPQRYKETVFEQMMPEVFKRVFPNSQPDRIKRRHLKGDGSDRQWYRLRTGAQSVIVVDHGLRRQTETSEVDAFVNIGRHLYSKGLPVPQIYHYDTLAGLIFLEDLGNINLQTAIQKVESMDQIIAWYESVINLVIKLSVHGAEGFDVSWTYQTPNYSKELILDRECRYFIEAFLNGYLGMEARFEDFQDDFEFIADKALEHSINGFMHRDMQSRNIMFTNRDFYFIDFQGGRIGPIQYDLASLLLDPYVELPDSVKLHLLDYSINVFSSVIKVDSDKFRRGFTYCALTRNLQILGAFGYLSTVKGKTNFEKYIPAALETLRHQLAVQGGKDLLNLKSMLKIIAKKIGGAK